MEGILALLIALLGVCIPVIVLTGRHVIQPLVQVLAELTRSPANPTLAEQRLTELTDRVERMERILTKVVEEQQFQRALQEGGSLDSRPAAVPLPRS